MDLGLQGRRAVLVGVEGDLATACRDVLGAEGVTVVGEEGVASADIVVASAPARPASAIAQVRRVEELSQAWDAVTEAVSAYRSALPAMAAHGWGRFVWVGTARAKALDASDDELSAIVSLAMMGLHKVIATEEGPNGCTANAVLRGGDATAAEVADAVAFVCSHGAGYLTGVTISVDGGAGSGVF